MGYQPYISMLRLDLIRSETRLIEVKNKLRILAMGFTSTRLNLARVRSLFLWKIIKMKPKRLVHGIGVNDADYVVQKFETTGYIDGKQKQKLVWTCKYYQTWVNMLERCYSAKLHERRPNYKGCTVSEGWITFSNFKEWMQEQNWEGMQLDKDLLIEGNKVYCAETCVFVTQEVNKFTNDNRAKRGDLLIGVSRYKRIEKFQSHCNNPFTKKQEHLGYFTTEMEAHQAWQVRKLELAHELAAIQTDPRVAKALVDRYSNHR